MVGVSEGISFGALFSVDLAITWALHGIAMGCLLGIWAARAKWVALDFNLALGGSPVGALLRIGAILLRVGYGWNISTLGGAAASVSKYVGTLRDGSWSPFLSVAF